MADTFELELVSPESLLLSEPVEMVVVPGEEGDFGVLAGHAPVISNIRPGTLAVFEGGSVIQRVFLAGGFAEVTKDRCTILAEGAVPVEDIDRADVEQEIRNLRDDIGAAADDAERTRAEAALGVAEAKLQSIDAPPYAGGH
jgi:F-type H+-transporting ATPase subunit epsilon